MNFKTLTKWYVVILVLSASYSIKAASLTQAQRAEISDGEAQDIMHETNEKRQGLNHSNAKTEEFIKLANAIPESTNKDLQQLKKEIVEQVTKFSSHHERQASNVQRTSISHNQITYSVADLEARYKNIGEQTPWELDALLENIHHTKTQTKDADKLEQLHNLAKSIGERITKRAKANRAHFSKEVNKTRVRTPKEKREQKQAAEAKRAEAKDEAETTSTTRASSGTLKSNGTDTTRLKKLMTKGSQTLLPLSYLTAKATLKKATEPRQVTTLASSSSSGTASGTWTPKNKNTGDHMVFYLETTPLKRFRQRFDELKRLPCVFLSFERLLADMRKTKETDKSSPLAEYEALEKEIIDWQTTHTQPVPRHRQYQLDNNRPSVQFDPKVEIPNAPKDNESETTKVHEPYKRVGTLFAQHDEQ